ncbi:MAG: phytanoyl-CoA dioxygenase family protein [Gemmatimonadota bacterium]
MRFNLKDMNGATLERAAREYEEQGYFILEGVDQAIMKNFRPILASMIGVSDEEMTTVLDPNSPPVILPVEVRQRLSRVTTTPELTHQILTPLGEVFTRLIGPLVHISSTFHAQFKGGDVKPVDHGGYDPNAQYLEVQGQYLIHQDFSGAAIPTTPCGLTLWVAMNSCPDWNLRLYPGSHRHGLLCNQWLPLDDARLKPFGEFVDVRAEAGMAVIFNSLLLHSSSNPGFKRRVSCDIRFFPFTGFLPSQVHVLNDHPLQTIRQGLQRKDGPTLRAPLLESLAFMGQEVFQDGVPPHSILNWANYLDQLLHGDLDGARATMERFVNRELGADGPEAYIPKFHNKQVHRATLSGVRDRIAALEPDAPELAGLDHLISGTAAVGA